jgi:hypothetical protein
MVEDRVTMGSALDSWLLTTGILGAWACGHQAAAPFSRSPSRHHDLSSFDVLAAAENDHDIGDHGKHRRRPTG